MPREFYHGGSTSHHPSAFAWKIWERFRFAFPLAKARIVADHIWELPDDRDFIWKAATVMSDTPKGYCPTCGVGWAPFLACQERERCAWIADGLGNPSPEWPAAVVAHGPSAVEGEPFPSLAPAFAPSNSKIAPGW